jgi:hypothetical protein
MAQSAPGTIVQPGAAIIPTGEPYITPGTLPPAGATGRPLAKVSDADGDVAWVDGLTMPASSGQGGGLHFDNGDGIESGADSGGGLQIRYVSGVRPRLIQNAAVVGDLATLNDIPPPADLSGYLPLAGGTMHTTSTIAWIGGYIRCGHESYLDVSGTVTIRCWTADSAGGTQTACDISKPNIAAYGYVTKSARDTKDNIRDLDVGQVDRDLMSLRAVSFTRFGQDSLGFIAEDSPDSVVVQCNDPSTTLGIDMGSVLALAVAKIQDLEARLAALEGK